MNHAKQVREYCEQQAVPCVVCGQLTFADDYGNTYKCPNCGWMHDGRNKLMEKWHGISYPMLMPLAL